MQKTIAELKELIDNNHFPIIHPYKNIQECITCCPINKEYLSECTHYLILTGYTDTEFSCRIITKTGKYGNHSVNSNQYVLLEVVPSFLNGIKFYSSSMYFMLFECMYLKSYVGYFKQM
jgi:hypothetical protein